MSSAGSIAFDHPNEFDFVRSTEFSDLICRAKEKIDNFTETGCRVPFDYSFIEFERA